MSKSSFSTIISTAKHPLRYKKENSNTYTNTNFSSNYNKSEYDEDKNSYKQNNSIYSHNSESFNKNFKELKLAYQSFYTFSIIETTLLLCISLFQYIYLRRLFEIKISL